MTDNISTQPLNSCTHPIPMFLLNRLFQNSSHATSLHSNPFLISPHRICRAALPSPHLHSQNPLLASFPLSASLHSSQLVTYCRLDSYTPHPDSTIALLFQYRDDHPLTISSLCTFFTLQKILLLPSSFFPL